MKTAPTKDDAARIAKALTPAVNALLLTTAYAQTEREKAEKIQRELLASEVFNGEDYTERGKLKKAFRVTDPKDGYKMLDDDFKRYTGKLNRINVANGFERARDGICPALAAERQQLKAERLLIDCAEEFFQGVTNDKILSRGLEERQKYIDLITGLVVTSPGYKNPLKNEICDTCQNNGYVWAETDETETDPNLPLGGERDEDGEGMYPCPDCT